MRSLVLVSALLVSGLALTACGGPAPLKPDVPTEQAGEPKPTATPPRAAPLPAPDTRVAAMNMVCGGDTFRVAFEDQRAVLVNDDGSNTELPLLPPDANAAPGVSIYTNGKISFYKSGGGDTQTVVRFARGKMAPQDCAIAVN